MDLSIEECEYAFKRALYLTLKTLLNASGLSIGVDVQTAWKCYTDDLLTVDILDVYKTRRERTTHVERECSRAMVRFVV
jgi:hypothetical protein